MNKDNARNNYSKTPKTVYIGKGSKWENPYTPAPGKNRDLFSDIPCDTMEEAYKAYVCYLERSTALLSTVQDLKGKTLKCNCCSPYCHSSILKEYADKSDDEIAELMELSIR